MYKNCIFLYFCVVSVIFVNGFDTNRPQIIEKSRFAHDPIEYMRSVQSIEKNKEDPSKIEPSETKPSEIDPETTTANTVSTHPTDNPNWKPPLSPYADERKPDFWMKNGQDQLKNRANLKTPNTNIAKNVILFIGDGMSLVTQMATRAYMGNENKYLSFEKFPYTGLSKTYALNYQVPDSANTGTALMTGIKTNYGTLGVSGDVRLHDCEAAQIEENQLKSIMKWAQEEGKATGIVTTTRLTHATPAATYAKTSDREYENNDNTPEECIDIAHQLIYGETGINFKVQLGGGSREFYPDTVEVHGNKGLRKDSSNLAEEWMELKNKNKTAKMVFNREDLLKVDASETDYLFGLFGHDHMSYHLEADKDEYPSLLNMTTKAIEILKKNEKGFVLMVEGGLIDRAHHRTFARMALDETVEFSNTIEYARKATSEEDTLIVVTADHGHVLTVGGYPERSNNILEVGDFSKQDNLPFLTLSYANGEGYNDHFNENGGRKNPDGMDKTHTQFRYPATVPLDDETHGGEDVGVFASGPWSHLFVGNYEQSYIFHAMMYASCMGDTNFEKPKICTGSAVRLTMTFSIMLPFLLIIKSTFFQ